MENFYVTFDATDLLALKIGVSQLAPKPRPSDDEGRVAPTKIEPTGSDEAAYDIDVQMFVILGIAVASIFILIAIVHCSCAVHRRRRLAKIAKTRDFLESMKNPQLKDSAGSIMDSSATMNLVDNEDAGETMSFGEST